ncbi:MAG: triose-phosphate isomerase [Pseudomonadota bacterium]
MTALKPLVVANWKMNGLKTSLAEIETVQSQATSQSLYETADIMFCLPATLLHCAVEGFTPSQISFGGQNCHVKTSGAYTGDISAEMLADVGAKAVIVGHSERRSDHGETSATVTLKAQAAHNIGLQAVICIGETAGERAANLTLKVIKRQIYDSVPKGATAHNTIIAYEPVWAIGTGLTPTPDDVAKVHDYIRQEISTYLGATNGDTMRLLYGGSVKPDNAKDLLFASNVNGALVGGASLKSEQFLGILECYKT